MSQFEFTPAFLLPTINERYFSVPLYQRSYSWTVDEVSDFWGDAMRSIEDGGEYFLGTIVLSEEADPGTFSIIDGQQRIATTTILLAAMRDTYRELGEAGIADTVQRQSISPHDLETYEDKPRLRLNATDNPYYFESIVNGGAPEPAAESHGRIQHAYIWLRDNLRKMCEASPGNWKSEFSKITRFLNKQARVVVVKASTDADAFTIFETLNDRGADLTIADLLKNYLFSRAHNELTSVQQRWIEAITILSEYQEEKEFVTFLRHLWSSQQGATRERDLYRRIKGSVTKKSDAVKLSESIRDGARLYGAILSPEAEFWAGYGQKTREMVETLDNFGLQQNRPLFLAVLQHFSKSEIEKAVRFMVSWSIRGIVAGGIGGGQAERYICDAAVAIRAGQIKTVSQLQGKLAAITASDTLFHQSFERFRITGNALARYMLLAIEQQLQGQKQPELVPNKDADDVNLEHILPRRPKPGDWDEFSPDDVIAYAYRIGNMTLLQKGKNSKIGNKPWVDKKPIIDVSELRLNKAIGGLTKWTPSEIEARQKDLANVDLKVWAL